METALTTEKRAVFVKLARYNKSKFKREVKSQITAVAAARAEGSDTGNSLDIDVVVWTEGKDEAGSGGM